MNIKDYHIHPSPPSKEALPFLSLYTEAKPTVMIPNEWDEEAIEQWHTTHFAYLRETEWKVGDKVYYKETGAILGDFAIRDFDYICTTKGRYKTRNISHFYPGQTVRTSEVSFVREVGICPKCNAHLDYQKYTEYWECPQCFLSQGNKGKYLLFEIVTSWQPSPEPDERIEIEIEYKSPQTPMNKFEPNPLHALWISDKEKGIVQAIINQT